MQSSISADAIITSSQQTDANNSTQSSFQDSMSAESAPPPTNEDNIERISQLEEELNAARNSIAEKEAKCNRLSELQIHMDSEVQELTEKLFQEAYKMVNEAESRRAKAERLLAESRLKVDMLSAEVEALKIIVKSPHTQIHISSPIPIQQQQQKSSSLASRFLTPSRKEKYLATPNNNLTTSRKSISLPATNRSSSQSSSSSLVEKANFEIDPVYHREFANWRESGAPLDANSTFLLRVMAEEIEPCLNFDNTELAAQVLCAIKRNTLELEPVKEKKPTVRMCALSNVPRFCPYRLRVNADAKWCFVSLLARNRIASVCDFFTYMRYVNQGIVKAGVHDSYCDVITLRKNMALARLGLDFIPKIGTTNTTNYS